MVYKLIELSNVMFLSKGGGRMETIYPHSVYISFNNYLFNVNFKTCTHILPGLQCCILKFGKAEYFKRHMIFQLLNSSLDNVCSVFTQQTEHMEKSQLYQLQSILRRCISPKTKQV